MKTKSLLFVFSVFCLFLFAGCSPGDVTGIYQHEAYSSITLELTKEGELIMLHTGDTADYNIVGDEITVTNPMYGMAVGTIKGKKLIFPDAEGVIAESLRGTWKKQ